MSPFSLALAESWRLAGVPSLLPASSSTAAGDIVIVILVLCECCNKQHPVLVGGKDYHLVWGEIPLGVVHILAGLHLLRRVDAANDFFMSFKFFFDNFQF